MIPTSTNIAVDVKNKLSPDTEAVVVFIAEKGVICGDAPHLIDDEMMNSVKKLIEAKVARGKAKEVMFDLLDADVARGRARRVFLAGVGKATKLDPESVRQAAGAIAKAVKKHRIASVAIVPPVLPKPGQSGAEAAVIGFLLASFDYDEYKGAASKKKETDEPKPSRVTLTILPTAASIKQKKPAVDRGRIIPESQNFPRTIPHRPANDINPPALAKVAQ